MEGTSMNNELKWISVEDELPKVGQVVLAFGKRSSSTGMFQGIQGGRKDLWRWKNNIIRHTSHWMPLPSPPVKNNS